MIERIYLNRNWTFILEDKEEIVDLPHNVKDIPFNYCNDEDYQFISTYKRIINLDKSYKNKHLILTFDGVAHRSEIYLNDVLLLEHFGGYDSFSVDLKDYLKFDEDNVLRVVVDAKEDPRIPPFGNVVDYLCYGGIYRDVYLDIKNEDHVIDAFFKPFHKGNIWGIDVEVELNTLHSYSLAIYDKEEIVTSINHQPKEKKHLISLEIPNPKLWDIDSPHLYKGVFLIKDNKKIIDRYEVTFGLRTCVFKKDGFYLNDKKIKIIGLNRHQSYPYVGYAMPKSAQEEDARILKEELCVNAVRTSHYPQSHYFINACDRLGLLVFTEIPGWQHVGDKDWQAISIKSVETMVKQYRNHPSIILWGVRINESRDNHDFYTETNRVAHELDSTRSTGGVRCFQKMELLEDVYTFNDFIDPSDKRALSKKKNVLNKKDMDHAYLVSEFNGHMHPAKQFDNELTRIEQARRITRAMNEFYGDDEIVGFFSWCMFDYNTHKDFGSGDRICYHGMLDMFRNPKVASYIYSSQGDKNFLKTSSLYYPGDYDASMIKELFVYTNADEIKLYRNDEYIRSFNKKDSPYPNIKHPPILIEDFIGNQLIDKEGYTKKESDMMKRVLISTLKNGSNMPLKDKLTFLRLMLFHHVNYQKGYELYAKYIGNWGSKESGYRIDAYKGGVKVNSISLAKAMRGHLDIKISSKELKEEETYDVSLIRIRAVDQSDNVMSYYQEPIEFIASGSIKVIGPTLTSFKGGNIGLYIRSVKKGKGTLLIKSSLGEEKINFKVE